MYLDKEFAQVILHATSGRKNRIIKALQENGYEVIDHTTFDGRLNLKVENPDGTVIRFYKPYRGKPLVQIWEPVEFRYSGVPTFEPSGRRSF